MEQDSKDKVKICPILAFNKKFVDESLCLNKNCQFWLEGYHRCSITLIASMLPYLKNSFEKFLNSKKKENKDEN